MVKKIVLSVIIVLSILVAALMIFDSSKESDVDLYLEIVSSQLDTDPNIASIEMAILDQFVIGMTQEEVYTIIQEIDPSLSALLGKDIECNQYHCNEVLGFYMDYFPHSIKIIFQYSEDFELQQFGLVSN